MNRDLRPLAVAVVAWLLTGSALAAEREDAALGHARELLASTILVDGHNDLPWVMRQWPEAPMDVERYDLRKPAPHETHLARLREGGVGAQFWSVYVPEELGGGFARTQLEQIDLARRMIARYPEALELALTSDDVRRAHATGRIASLLGMERGHVIENSLGALRAYY